MAIFNSYVSLPDGKMMNNGGILRNEIHGCKMLQVSIVIHADAATGTMIFLEQVFFAQCPIFLTSD